MFALKRNQVVITSLVVMIGVAGYLNHAENTREMTQITLDDHGNIATSPLVSNEFEVIDASSIQGVSLQSVREEQMLTQMSDSPLVAVEHKLQNSTLVEDQREAGEAVFVSTHQVSDNAHFVSARLEREQSRAMQKEILVELINNEFIEAEQKAESAEAMLNMQRRIEKETAAESMIESRGFSDAYVRIDDQTVDVIVNKETLTEAEIAQIEDIVKRKTGMESSAIRISTMRR
jgi:stage III sporulation protein AH